MCTVAPSEDVAMGTLGKDLPKTQLTQSEEQEQSLEDAEATLPWDQAQCDAVCETAIPGLSKTDARPSPEGSIKEAVLGSATGHEVFLPAPKDKDDESIGLNSLPTHFCVPLDPLCIECPPAGDKRPLHRSWEFEGWTRGEEDHPEKQTFLAQGYSADVDDLPGCPREQPRASCCARLSCCQESSCSNAGLKAVASMVGAMVIFPCLIYGAYLFLPFDVPAMTTMSARLVYTLRCGAFATFPIILGMTVYGVSRLCTSSLQPFGELQKEVEIHRRYVSQSVDLFILYFFNIAVLSTYLPQEALKLIPLLTALFAISRLLYWMAYSMGRSFRGFGFGMTFFPLATMLVFNLYSMFLVDVESVFATAGGQDGPPEERQLAASRPRFWG